MNITKTILALLFVPLLAEAQQTKKPVNEIYIDKSGILRLQANNQEASYFGVNYTLPFAYGYRSHKKLNIDIEQAIDKDVYHLARLGINAFRVHVWDTEISDSLGNLKNNDHLRLFDYLIAKLEERGIRILVTPIAFWGNGYPDEDEKTGSFVERYTKGGAVVEEQAFVAQERYLDQFFRHVNPYTKKSYGEDPYVIATEINNEPKHSGPKSRATEYVNRMVSAVRKTGWTKPIFYNISESPTYADAVAASTADGYSFQWYPTGLVAGHEQQGNLLPHVDRYQIPFDTIPAFRNKPRMIYEFESADVLKPYMYPAMARSFKTAGMQWATQFAYDPLGTAYANTEYQTHYLNLAYTPAKAISLLIASRIFHQMPAYKDYGSFPANTSFAGFELDHQTAAAQMNTPVEYYYTSGTSSKPVNIKALTHIAGVGSSPVLKYKGNGAYFLDKIKDGVWRLEVMPDVKELSDPFGKNELDKPVRTTVWGIHDMEVVLPDLGEAFSVLALNAGNKHQAAAKGRQFQIAPGTYLLRKNGIAFKPGTQMKVGVLGMNEFVAPEKVYSREGVSLATDSSKTRAASDGSLLLFDGTDDAKNVVVYAPSWETDPYTFVPRDVGSAHLSLKHKPSGGGQTGGAQVYVKDLLQNAAVSFSGYKAISVDISGDKRTSAKIILVDAQGNAVAATFPVGTQTSEVSIPLNTLKPDEFMLLPRPYPGFQPLYFSAKGTQAFNLQKLEKIQVLLLGDDQANEVRLGRIKLLR
jgi:hypothetical protein